MPLEKDLEEKCRQLVRARNGELLPFRSPGHKGVHDRLLILRGFMGLVEFKRGKKAKVQPLQDYWQDRCTQLQVPAFRVVCLNDFHALLHLIDLYDTVQRKKQRFILAGSQLIDRNR